MLTFITRVELHDADADDYEALHEEMDVRGFERTITAVDGTVYQLPTAEYVCESERTASEVCEIAKAVADATLRKSWIITCEYTNAAWDLDET